MCAEALEGPCEVGERREFTTNGPNRVWVGDITYVWTAQGWGYLAVLLDLFGRRVVGWAFADHMRTELPRKALQRALDARSPAPGLIHHSDRGSQYASREYRNVLVDHQVACSMSHAGDCYDNAVAESFFASIKKECLSRVHFVTFTEAYDAIAAYIDGFYNPVRRHSALGYLSPINYENFQSGIQAARSIEDTVHFFGAFSVAGALAQVASAAPEPGLDRLRQLHAAAREALLREQRATEARERRAQHLPDPIGERHSCYEPGRTGHGSFDASCHEPDATAG